MRIVIATKRLALWACGAVSLAAGVTLTAMLVRPDTIDLTPTSMLVGVLILALGPTVLVAMAVLSRSSDRDTSQGFYRSAEASRTTPRYEPAISTANVQDLHKESRAAVASVVAELDRLLIEVAANQRPARHTSLTNLDVAAVAMEVASARRANASNSPDVRRHGPHHGRRRDGDSTQLSSPTHLLQGDRHHDVDEVSA